MSTIALKFFFHGGATSKGGFSQAMFRLPEFLVVRGKKNGKIVGSEIRRFVFSVWKNRRSSSSEGMKADLIISRRKTFELFQMK